MRVKFAIDLLKRMPRPAGYLDEMRACAIAVHETWLEFETDSPGYKALQSKYASCEPDLTCIHRGAALDPIRCPSCSGTVMAKTFACTIHGRCSLFAKPIEGVKSCRTCADRQV